EGESPHMRASQMSPAAASRVAYQLKARHASRHALRTSSREEVGDSAMAARVSATLFRAAASAGVAGGGVGPGAAPKCSAGVGWSSARWRVLVLMVSSVGRFVLTP